MSLAENLVRVQEKIDRAAGKSGRSAGDIRLIAVTKTLPVPAIQEALAAGIREIGENRVQEAKDKFPKIGSPVRWHLIGHLQTNKVKPALEIFDLIQSVDSFPLAEEIQKRAEVLQKKVSILVQLNTSFEVSKFGCPPEEAATLVEKIAGLPNLMVSGLMTIGAFLPDPENVRPSFKLLRECYDKIKAQKISNVTLEILSMGMSNDFEIAIEEGSNMVRIGTALFGTRSIK